MGLKNGGHGISLGYWATGLSAPAVIMGGMFVEDESVITWRNEKSTSMMKRKHNVQIIFVTLSLFNI